MKNVNLIIGLVAVAMFGVIEAEAATEHVVVILEENHNYNEAMSDSGMPYLNSLAKQFSYCTHFYGNTHPSIGNYFMLTMGKVLTNDDKYVETVDGDNIVRHLISSGKTWKSYAEGIPSAGYVGGNIPSTEYIARHNPLSFFSDVRNDPKQAQNIVPFEQFSKDIQNHSLPNFSFIVPNGDSDAHNKGSTLKGADDWLKNNIDPLVNDPDFQKSGLLIVTFDEASTKDKSHGGGHIAWVAVGSEVKRNYKSDTLYQHENALAMICKHLELAHPWPGDSEKASTMDEFFTLE